MPKITRTDKWTLAATQMQRQYLSQTVAMYRDYVRLLIGVVWTHWPAIASAESQCFAVERLVHATAKNPNPRYRLFDRRFHKFPSYLRRAAIEAACGQVSSFVTRYAQWQSGRRKRRDVLPPLRTNGNALNPPLYRGQCIKFDDGYTVASIKVWNGSDWVWADVPIKGKRNRHALPTHKAQSPMLLIGKRAMLSIPLESSVKFPPRKSVQRVCAIDLGINTTATASIVTKDGTVVARKFFHRGADIDRRDKGLAQISSKARQTMGATGKLHRGFCANAYRKAANRNREMVNHLSGAIIAFALAHGAQAIVFEHLKHFRPKAGRKGSPLRQRFHGWLHRKLVMKVKDRAEEACLRTEFVQPAGTSKYAFDGSGEVKRDPKNRALATFANGKRYNADLSASYNIGARFFAWVLGLSARNGKACVSGKSPRTQPGIPVTLSTLWLYAQCGRVAEQEAPSTAPSGA